MQQKDQKAKWVGYKNQAVTLIQKGKKYITCPDRIKMYQHLK